MKLQKKNSLIDSFGFAFKGLVTAFNERNFRLHLVSAFLVVCLGFWLDISNTEWLIVLMCIGLVVSLELVNTAIEHLVDLVAPEFNEKAGKVKDIAAAAVFVASIIAFITGLVIFLPLLLQ